MNRASVVCVPSVTRRSGEEEGFETVWRAVAKPVVAFNSGGIPEVSGGGGRLPDLSRVSSDALAEPGVESTVGRSGRQWIVR